ncbi:Fic family protein, partial [Staphylococcus succinus]
LITELKIKKSQLDYVEEKLNNDDKLRALSDAHKDILFEMAQTFYFSSEEFTTVQDLKKRIKLSDKTIRKFLNELCEIGYIDKEGTRPAFYKISEHFII